MPAPQRVARPGRRVQGSGLVIDGHDPDAAETAALAWLADKGLDRFDMRQWRNYLRNHDAAIVKAWWGGDAVGFCQAHHPNARPVTVVNLPDDLTAD